MSAPDELVIRTADSIASGDNVDWQGLHQQAPDPQQSRILTEMQVLERIAAFLRSSDSDQISEKATIQRPKPAMPESWAHFRLIELIGEGGFGSVYRARDTKLQTEVALKLVALPGGRELRPGVALKEARLLARVRHTNVVTVYGADIVDGCVGIWMQLIEGQTLASLLRANGPFGAQESALVGVDLCRALAAVHAAALIHGDLKTRNVMREAGGRTVLMDFGTGRDLSALRLHGVAEPSAGTPLYFAPEVLEGKSQSKVTDIYSLGVLLYHLATNDYPVKGETQAEIEDAHRRGEYGSLRDARPDLPQSFIALVERALSRDPRDRFQTAGAFEAALAEFLGQTRRPVPEPSPWRRWLNLAAVTGAMALLSVATVWVTRQLNRTELRTVDAQPLAVAGPATAAGYQIEPVLYKEGRDESTRLRAGDRVAPGDQLFMRLTVSAPTYLYVVNEDDRGDSFVLFPLPGRAVDNPIPSETAIRIPGTSQEKVNWELTSVGEREHFIVFASPERMQEFEEIFATLPQPVVGRKISYAPIPKETLSKLRAVGGLTAPQVQASANFSSLFTLPLIDGAETAHGMWVRQLTLLNPVGGR
jgi:serine/threonine-protein kinase